LQKRHIILRSLLIVATPYDIELRVQMQPTVPVGMQCVAVVFAAMLQRVAACCSVLQCVAVCCSMLNLCFSVLQCVAVCCSMLHVLVYCCCSVLQCVAVCCSVLQCVAACCRKLAMTLNSKSKCNLQLQLCCCAVCCSVLRL